MVVHQKILWNGQELKTRIIKHVTSCKYNNEIMQWKIKVGFSIFRQNIYLFSIFFFTIVKICSIIGLPLEVYFIKKGEHEEGYRENNYWCKGF